MITNTEYSIIEIVSNYENTTSRLTHAELVDRTCIIADCEVGRPAWLFVNFPEEESYNKWHRIITSFVLDIDEKETDIIKVTTENTIYTFRRKIIYE